MKSYFKNCVSENYENRVLKLKIPTLINKTGMEELVGSRGYPRLVLQDGEKGRLDCSVLLFLILRFSTLCFLLEGRRMMMKRVRDDD